MFCPYRPLWKEWKCHCHLSFSVRWLLVTWCSTQAKCETINFCRCFYDIYWFSYWEGFSALQGESPLICHILWGNFFHPFPPHLVKPLQPYYKCIIIITARKTKKYFEGKKETINLESLMNNCQQIMTVTIKKNRSVLLATSLPGGVDEWSQE